MKSLLILGTLILLINGDSFPCEKKTNPHTETEYEYDLYQWPGNLDTISTNVFYPSGKRRLFY